jgi:hypothetical protein
MNRVVPELSPIGTLRQAPGPHVSTAPSTLGKPSEPWAIPAQGLWE